MTTRQSKKIRDETDFPERPVRQAVDFVYYEEYSLHFVQRKTELDPALLARLSDPKVKDFFTVLAICNTVVVSSSKVESKAGSHLDPSILPDNELNLDLHALKYEAESPDEGALVHVCVK